MTFRRRGFEASVPPGRSGESAEAEAGPAGFSLEDVKKGAAARECFEGHVARAAPTRNRERFSDDLLCVLVDGMSVSPREESVLGPRRGSGLAGRGDFRRNRDRR